VYSLGVVLYELISGRLPFEHKKAHDVMKAHVHERPERLDELVPGVPRELAAIVMRCLAKKRRARFQDMRALRDALAALLTRSRAPRRPRAPGPRRMLLAAAVVALVLGAGAAAVRQQAAASMARRDDPGALAVGAAVFASRCERCHAEPSFPERGLQPEVLDRFRFEVVRRGVHGASGHSMPAFADRLTVDEIWKVVGYMRQSGSTREP
jgi:mono/diheme cytochrome c family protein